MLRNVLRILSLILVFNLPISSLEGMSNSRRVWTRFSQTAKNYFSRLSSQTAQWAQKFNQIPRYFSAFHPSNTGNRLGGLTAAAMIFAQHQHQNQQKVQTVLTTAHIDAHPELKQQFINIAKTNITTQEPAKITIILHILKKYPEAAAQLYPLVLQNCTRVHPSIQKAVSIFSCVRPEPQQSMGTEKSGFEKLVSDVISAENILWYGVLPIIDIHGIDKNGKRVMDENMSAVVGMNIVKPIHQWPHAIAAAVIPSLWTDGAIQLTDKLVKDTTGYSIACPIIKSGDYWNFAAHHSCVIGKRLLISPLITMGYNKAIDVITQ